MPLTLQDLEQKQQELDALTTRIQNLEDVSTRRQNLSPKDILCLLCVF